MSFWEFIWMIFKAGLFVVIGIPFILICLLLLILILL